MFALLEVEDPVPGGKCVGHRKLLYLEKLFAALLVAGPNVIGQLRGRISGIQIVGPDGAGYRTALLGLEALLTFWIPAAFRIGVQVRHASWEGRSLGGGKKVFSMLGQTLHLLVHLIGVGTASGDPYVRTISCALKTWQDWYDDLPGVCFVEESCEAMLSRFGHRLEVNKHIKTFDETYVLKSTILMYIVCSHSKITVQRSKSTQMRGKNISEKKSFP